MLRRRRSPRRTSAGPTASSRTSRCSPCGCIAAGRSHPPATTMSSPRTRSRARSTWPTTSSGRASRCALRRRSSAWTSRSCGRRSRAQISPPTCRSRRVTARGATCSGPRCSRPTTTRSWCCAPSASRLRRLVPRGSWWRKLRRRCATSAPAAKRPRPHTLHRVHGRARGAGRDAHPLPHRGARRGRRALRRAVSRTRYFAPISASSSFAR